MTISMRTFGIAAKGTLLALAAMLSITAAQASVEVNINDGAAVHGYDVVAYFTEGRPVRGDGAYTAEHEGATYRFASAGNRDAFVANPAKYAPQYGGYCGFGTAMGRKFDGDPLVWAIYDGKLYLNLNKGVQNLWKGDIAGFVRGANHNWPIIRGIEDSSLESTPPQGLTIGAQ